MPHPESSTEKKTAKEIITIANSRRKHSRENAGRIDEKEKVGTFSDNRKTCTEK